MKNSILTALALIMPLMSSFNTQADEVKIASWNIAWLGSHEYNQRSEADYQQLALYAKQLNADVIALQEVESEYWARKVFGDDYDYYFSTKDWVQRVGVAVKKSQDFSVKAKEYKALDIGKVRHGMDITLTKNDKTLHLLAVHLKSGCFANPLDKSSINAMPSKSDKEVRRKEACDKLNKQIEPLEQWINLHAEQNSAYIILGDFNRRFSQDISLKYSEDQGLWQALNDEGQSALWTPTMTINSDCWDGYYKDYIDHIIFSPKAKTKYIDNSFKQLVFKEKYTKKLSRNLSDHCPISVQLKL
ncbi:endonuclease/exonuclease/phosphatase family protein [Colwellia psychrerythraea]|uniref:Endonuclease/exonuclease/phosphatase n=1 Tax=Colwellia psychrerythraea TaxID=28229 RepID=A0A099KI67_COLPS|nr:endonuclease/exonuclease/phosphatase family protein [Colwellia psychrerythraea]KGJ89950.1 Endonuclease/exonuclease/phosphatase [Colwellia psychrerythraea]